MLPSLGQDNPLLNRIRWRFHRPQIDKLWDIWPIDPIAAHQRLVAICLCCPAHNHGSISIQSLVHQVCTKCNGAQRFRSSLKCDPNGNLLALAAAARHGLERE